MFQLGSTFNFTPSPTFNKIFPRQFSIHTSVSAHLDGFHNPLSTVPIYFLDIKIGILRHPQFFWLKVQRNVDPFYFQDGRWYLAGITSFGSGCAKPGFPDVFVRVRRLNQHQHHHHCHKKSHNLNHHHCHNLKQHFLKLSLFR